MQRREIDKFYKSCFEVGDNDIEVYDTLLHRYGGNIDFVMDLPFQEGFELIIKAFEKKREQRMWERYITIYPYMNKENYVSFEEFCGETLNVDNSICEDEILSDVKTILG